MGAIASQITSFTIIYWNRLFRRISNKTSKLCLTYLCAGNSPVTAEFPHKWPVTRKMFPFDDVIMRKSMASRYIFCYLLLRHGHVISSHSFFEDITPHSCSYFNSNLVTTPLNNRDHRHRRHYPHHHLTVVLQYFNESYLFRSTSSIRFVCCAIFLSRQGGLCVSDQTWS